MRISTIFTVLIFVAVATSTGFLRPYKLPGTDSVFLGTVEDKSYLTDRTIKRNWNEAKEFCASRNMRLASVETPAQKEFLAGVNHPQFQGIYWTAARDTRSTQQFVWDHNNISMSANFDDLVYYIDAWTCVVFAVDPVNIRYSSTLCEISSTSYGEFGTLCQSL